MLLPSLITSVLAALSLWVLMRRDPVRDPRLPAIYLLVLLVLPLLTFLPKVVLPMLPVKDEAVGGNGVASLRAGLSWTELTMWVWAGGFVLFSGLLLRDYLALRRWKKEASRTPLESQEVLLADCCGRLGYEKERPALQWHPRLESPVVCGLIRPVIYLPLSSREWSEETLRHALLHEMAHLARRDLWLAVVGADGVSFSLVQPTGLVATPGLADTM